MKRVEYLSGLNTEFWTYLYKVDYHSAFRAFKYRYNKLATQTAFEYFNR